MSTADSPHSLGRWQDHVRNDEVAARTGLRPVTESIRRRREAIFGHVARMSPNIPAHQALRLQVEASVGRRPDRDWVRSSGRQCDSCGYITGGLEIVAFGSVEPGALGVGAGRPGGGRPLPPRGSGGIIPGKFFEIYITVNEFSCHCEVGALQWVVVKKTLNIAFSNFYRNMYATLATVLLQHMLVYSW